MASEPVYEYPQRMDMTSTYTSNGRVISTAQAVSETPAGYDQGYKVETVLVKVGDTVRQGDPLYTIDTTSIETDLAQNQKKLALQQQQNSIDAQSKARAASSAKAAAAQQAADAQRAVNEASLDTDLAIQVQNNGVDSVSEALQKQQEAQNKYDEAKKTSDAAESRYESLKAQNDAAQAKINSAQQLSDTAQARVDRLTAEGQSQEDEGYQQAAGEAGQRKEELTQLQAANLQLSADLTAAKEAAETAKTDLGTAKNELDLAKDAVKNAMDAVNTNAADTLAKQKALEQSASDAEKNNRDAENAAGTASDDLQSQIVSGQTNLIDTQTAIEQDQQKLKDKTIYADMDGTVTEVNVVAGQTYSGSEAVTISNLQALTVATDVDEAHITSIRTGMKVTMTTDASGTMPLSGKVVSVADFPTVTGSDTTTTATSSSAASGTGSGLLTTKQKAYYRVQVMPDEGFAQLREGMNTRITFILAEAKDAIAVPKDTVNTNPDGTAYLMVVDNGNLSDSTGGSTESMEVTGEEGTGTAAATDAAVTAATADTAFSEAAVDTGDGGQAPTVQLNVTTGIEQGEMVQITSDNVTEDMQLVGPNTYNSYGYDSTDGSDSSSLLEGIYG